MKKREKSRPEGLLCFKVFNLLSLFCRDDEGSLTSDVVVYVDETRDINLRYGLRYSTEDRLEVLGGVRFPALFGSAHRAALTFVINANQSIFRGNYSMPYFWR